MLSMFFSKKSREFNKFSMMKRSNKAEQEEFFETLNSETERITESVNNHIRLIEEMVDRKIKPFKITFCEEDFNVLINDEDLLQKIDGLLCLTTNTHVTREEFENLINAKITAIIAVGEKNQNLINKNLARIKHIEEEMASIKERILVEERILIIKQEIASINEELERKNEKLERNKEERILMITQRISIEEKINALIADNKSKTTSRNRTNDFFVGALQMGCTTMRLFF